MIIEQIEIDAPFFAAFKDTDGATHILQQTGGEWRLTSNSLRRSWIAQGRVSIWDAIARTGKLLEAKEGA